ncbi:DUF7130 family rubredoxin-like protein [Natrialba sp. SSL1]|uniref:DUF7130 family rubredoxin-like protein n=1 Tax=Natrialba sp. SSL1 TaxID=1869245 RepID=UPI0008F847EA|nr:hypothetical protein [Natrialba sp. SSL1]OIB58989.1 hypothetical protein BBD46_05645 [Natrialba sp. SSL1]
MTPDNDQLRTRSGVDKMEETEIPIGEPHDSSEASYSMWRCGDCGEMGQLEDGLPEECPNCSAPKEDLYYWEED